VLVLASKQTCDCHVKSKQPQAIDKYLPDRQIYGYCLMKGVTMNIDNLLCIDLDLPSMTGFRKFISSWLYRGDDFNLLVDPGPLSAIPRLCEAVRREGVSRIDYVLITHIHIDHAGGVGALLKEFPDACVICHPEGIRHMVAPQKLWEGSRTVLGALADAYGEIVSVPEDRIMYDEFVGGTGVRAFQTPGHASHHCCYQLDELLFAGEVAGVRADLPGRIYMRPATPPRFMLEVAQQSIDRMIALAPRYLAFGHYGLVTTAVEHLQIARAQLHLWVRGVAQTAAVEPAGREQALVEWLLQHDEYYCNFNLLPQDIQSRERYFFGNTMRGMSEYVAGLPEEQRLELMS